MNTDKKVSKPKWLKRCGITVRGHNTIGCGRFVKKNLWLRCDGRDCKGGDLGNEPLCPNCSGDF